MEKLYSNIIGEPVYENDSMRPFTTVKDLIIDPERGDTLGIVVDFRNNMMIAPIDVVSWGESVRVDHSGVVTEVNEVLRVDDILKRGIHIPHSLVVSKDGEKLGRVYDYSIDQNSWKLNKIFVHKVFFGLIKFDTRIIPAKDIVEINEDEIIVKDDVKTVKEKVPENVSAQDVAMG